MEVVSHRASASTTQDIARGGDKFTFPITSKEDLEHYLASPQAPKILIAMTFTDQLLRALQAAGKTAMTADRRLPEHKGPSFQGEVRTIVEMKVWDAIYFTGPNCYQHLRRDHLTLQEKLDDGRAYWAGAMVLWCICVAYAIMIIVEQPDTICHDHFNLSDMPGVEVREIWTSQYRDKKDKFMRLTLRNVQLEEPPLATRPAGHVGFRRPAIHEYANADEADRDRSSWSKTKYHDGYPNLCKSLATAEARDPKPTPLDYQRLVRGFKSSFEKAGHGWPVDFDSPTGEATNAECRAYQLVRGKGDGRTPRGHARGGSASRRAEAGDQRVESNQKATFLAMVDRRIEQGRSLTTQQWDHLLALEHKKAQPWRAEEIIFFWKATDEVGAGCCSNYFESKFCDPTIKGGDFDNVEQYMHYLKAILAGSAGTAMTIRAEADPNRCRAIGREVTGLDVTQWDALSSWVVERGIYHKFDQNQNLRQYLKSTCGMALVEASPTDKRWGIGHTAENALTAGHEQWGRNLLGRALMRARLRIQLGMPTPMPRQIKDALREAEALSGGTRRQRRRARERRMDGHEGQHDGLSKTLWRLAEALQPSLEIVECGGKGACGPNSLAYAAWAHGLINSPDGTHFRRMVMARAEYLLQEKADWEVNGDGTRLTVADMLAASYRSWAAKGVTPTAQGWVRRMSLDTTWADQGFLALAADYLGAEVQYYAVGKDGVLDHINVIYPRPGVVPIANLKLAYIIEEHYCAVVPRGTERHPGHGQRTKETRDEPEPMAGGSDEKALIESADAFTEWKRHARSMEAAWHRDEELQRRREQKDDDVTTTLGGKEGPHPQTNVTFDGSAGDIAQWVERTRAAETEWQQDETASLSRCGTKDDTDRDGADASEQRATPTVAYGEDLWLSDDDIGEHDLGSDLCLSDGDLDHDDADLDLDNETSDPSDCEAAGGPNALLHEDGDFHDEGLGDLDLDEFVEADGGATRGGSSPELTSQPLAPPGPDPMPGGEQNEPREAGEHQGQTPALARHLPQLGGGHEPDGSLIIVPYAIAEDGPMVLCASSGRCFGLEAARLQTTRSSVEQAEDMVRIDNSPVTGILAGRGERGQKLVLVATQHRTGEAKATKKRQSGAWKAATLACWCTAMALGHDTWQGQVGRVAITAASHFLTHDGSTTALLKAETSLRSRVGLEAGRTGYRAPIRAKLDTTGSCTASELLDEATHSLEDLKRALNNVEGGDQAYYRHWAEAVKPLRVSDISQDLWEEAIALGDHRLRTQLFSEPLPVYETRWLERMPTQEWRPPPQCQGYSAPDALSLLDDTARAAIEQWFEAAVRDAECLESQGERCDRRHKPGTLAIGQDQFHECARGYLWDCRDSPCRLLDTTGEFSTDWNLPFLRDKLRNYPDQRLASNILEGVRLEADLDLTLVLNPNLVSIGVGYDSVQKTVRELRDRGFYDFFQKLPFMPIVVVGQGSRIKKLGVKKYRRTSNFSGPHKKVTDAKGNAVVPINEASKRYAIPEWLANSKQEAIRRWAHEKYAHVPTREDGASTSPRYKFPKERKPELAKVMGDGAILLAEALRQKQPIFVLVEDAAFFFNQFGYAPEELWKSNLIVNARMGDIDHEANQFAPGQLVFVSEKRLGFGSYASSNIAQRIERRPQERRTTT